SSSTGPIMRQGPHQGAQKSTSTGSSDCSTSASKVASVMGIVYCATSDSLLPSDTRRGICPPLGRRSCARGYGRARRLAEGKIVGGEQAIHPGPDFGKITWQKFCGKRGRERADSNGNAGGHPACPPIADPWP